jgi:hypothetical protein
MENSKELLPQHPNLVQAANLTDGFGGRCTEFDLDLVFSKGNQGNI